MGPDKSVKEKSELVEQLVIQIYCKNQGVRRLAWGIALGIFNFALDGLYNTFLFFVARGDLKASWVRTLTQFLLNIFFCLLFEFSVEEWPYL